jgi:hypothetical protein
MEKFFFRSNLDNASLLDQELGATNFLPPSLGYTRGAGFKDREHSEGRGAWDKTSRNRKGGIPSHVPKACGTVLGTQSVLNKCIH